MVTIETNGIENIVEGAVGGSTELTFNAKLKPWATEAGVSNVSAYVVYSVDGGQSWSTNYFAVANAATDEKTVLREQSLRSVSCGCKEPVSSAAEDPWAGPRGEFASALFASPAWGLYGVGGLGGRTFPAADAPLQSGNVGYHVRTGHHGITDFDWERYMDFAEGKGWGLRKP